MSGLCVCMRFSSEPIADGIMHAQVSHAEHCGHAAAAAGGWPVDDLLLQRRRGAEQRPLPGHAARERCMCGSHCASAGIMLKPCSTVSLLQTLSYCLCCAGGSHGSGAPGLSRQGCRGSARPPSGPGLSGGVVSEQRVALSDMRLVLIASVPDNHDGETRYGAHDCATIGHQLAAWRSEITTSGLKQSRHQH